MASNSIDAQPLIPSAPEPESEQQKNLSEEITEVKILNNDMELPEVIIVDDQDLEITENEEFTEAPEPVVELEPSDEVIVLDDTVAPELVPESEPEPIVVEERDDGVIVLDEAAGDQPQTDHNANVQTEVVDEGTDAVVPENPSTDITQTNPNHRPHLARQNSPR